MRVVVWGLALMLALVFQATLLPLIAFHGARPDLPLMIAVSFGLLRGREHGVGAGFFGGLIQDLASGNIFGLNILPKLAVGYLAGTMERNVFKENILLPVMAVIAATFISGALTICLLFVLELKADILAALVNISLTAGYNALLAIPVHRLVYWLAGNHTAEQR